MGYDRERFVGEVNEGLLCSICREVLEDPVLTPCEHAFCGRCIRRWLEEDHPHCPEDRSHLEAAQLRPLGRYMKNDWAQLRIRCWNQPHGCEFISTLERIHRHEEQCDPASLTLFPRVAFSSPESLEDRPSSKFLFFLNAHVEAFSDELERKAEELEIKKQLLKREMDEHKAQSHFLSDMRLLVDKETSRKTET